MDEPKMLDCLNKIRKVLKRTIKQENESLHLYYNLLEDTQ